MAEHSELVAELSQIDKMSTQERLKLAKRRRMQQLKKWSQREKEYNSNKKKKELAAIGTLSKKSATTNVTTGRSSYKVHFVPSVMLLEAASRNDVEEVRRLLMLGVSPDSTNEDGLTALHQCCIDDSEEMLRLLLEFGANVNAKDSEQWTPLHAAATCGHIHIVKYLISRGADLLAVNADGNMPYDICEDDLTLDYIENEMARRGVTQEMIDQTRAAIENKMLKDLKNLSIQGHELDLRDEHGATPLHIAAANGYLSVMKFLLDHHLQVDARDEDMWQPIHAAACWGHPDAIEILVQAGADLNAKTKNGEMPYDISEDPEVRERIVQLKYEMETKRGSQSNRLRRSHSQNTRSQSIRRTSIREKAQISRREAREEARLRQEKEKDTKLYDSEDDGKQQLESNQDKIENHNNVDPKDIDLTFVNLQGKDTLQKFKAKSAFEALEQAVAKKNNSTYSPRSDKNDLSKSDPKNESKRNVPSSFVSEESSNKTKSSSEFVRSGTVVQTTETSVIQPSPGQSVNVEIHVMVNTSPTYSSGQGTLADLKKVRSNERHRNSTSSSSSQQEMTGKMNSQNGHYGTSSYSNPPSPAVPRKFRGDPLEIVGSKKKRGCCVIM